MNSLKFVDKEFIRHSCIEPGIINALKECITESAQSWKITGFPVVVVATCNDIPRVPSSILSCFKHEVIFEVRQCDDHE
jgi:hypothetical protein